MKILVAIFVLWLPFSLGALAAIVVAFWAIFFDWGYAKKLLKLLDKLCAGVLGFSGEYTISAECGRAECRFCKVVCWLLDFIQPGHCKGAAEREGKQ